MRSSPEFDLIAAIRDRLGSLSADSATGPDGAERPLGVGDDAAVTVPGGATATSIDALVDGVHFRRTWCPPAAVGHKALASALSDLAAMGAAPGEAYVWLGRPDDLSEQEVLDLAGGIGELAREEGVAVLGGDLTGSPVLSIAITVVGHAPAADRFVGRSGAGEGDAVCMTGSIGGAAAGLMLLEHPGLSEEIEPALVAALRERQLRPSPRLAAGMSLAAAGATAMIDLSDGLGADAEHLAAASGRGLEIELERVPLQEGVAELADRAGRDRHALALGGEDYELLCTFPRAALGSAGEALSEQGLALTEIGRVNGGPGVRLRLPGGRAIPSGGHDHARR